MNAFLKKEIRLLLPNFGFACALAVAWVFFSKDISDALNGVSYFMACVFCPAVAVMLALSSFGVEIGSGTFANLLAQPMSRQKIWETKITLLAGALLMVAMLWMAAFLFSVWHNGQDHGVKDWLDLFTIVGLTGIVIFTGGLWTVLLLRQVAAAFWFALLVPGALVVLLAAFFADQDPNLFQGLIISVLGIYSLAGFFFARWLFFRAQDLQWSGGNIEMPEMRGLARFRSGVSLRGWNPRGALWRKEFMLHQSQLVMAFALAVLHGGVLVARHFTDKNKSPELYFILEIFWGLWFVLPMLVGCAAVAEERKLGTLDQQLCLPVKRRTQFAIKLVVAMGLSFIFGAVMPLLLEGTRILPGIHFGFLRFNAEWFGQLTATEQNIWFALDMLQLMLPFFLFVFAALIIGGVSFFVSTLTRNTLQSLAPAVLGIFLATTLLVFAGQPWNQWREFMWVGPAPYLVGVPILILTLLILAAKNFQISRPTLRTGGMNLAVLVGAILVAAVATLAVYHRCWEKLTPFEPPHGPARLSMKDDVRLNMWWAEANVRFSDGRIWNAPFFDIEKAATPLGLLFGKNYLSLNEGMFYPGSNWVDIRRYGLELVGTKTDGTLWISEPPPPAAKLRRGNWREHEQRMRNLLPYGSETNWASAVPGYLSALLVKTDGSLWRLGTNRFDHKKETWPGLRSFSPYRLGDDSDWEALHLSYHQNHWLKRDGSIWTQDSNSHLTNRLKSVELEEGYTLVQLYDGKHGRFRATTEISYGMRCKLGIREDGTLRVWANMQLGQKSNSRYSTYEFAPADFQIGSETNWVALAGGDEKVVALKSDGTLWLWNFRRSQYQSRRIDNLEEEIQQVVPSQLGKHSDWVSISGHESNLVALAADGSLWFWPVADTRDYFRDGFLPLLDVSRKPQLLGNIFAGIK